MNERISFLSRVAAWNPSTVVKAALLLLAIAAAYAPVAHAGFVWDDDIFITGNEIILSSDGWYRIWVTTDTLDYYPLTWTLVWGLWRLWGANPVPYHLLNVVLHMSAALLVWAILQRLRLLPIHLAAIYPKWRVDPNWVLSYLPLAAAIAYAVAAWRARNTWGRAHWLALVYCTAMLLPVLGLVDIAYMQHSLVADHWQYLSLVGSIALLVGAAATRVSSWSAPARGAACLVGAAIVVLSTALAHAQAATYHDSGKLWRHSLAINSDSWCAHYNLARYLVLEAGPGEANPLEAIHHFEEALRRKPDHPHAHRQVALVLAWRGDFERAAEHFVAALGLDPNAPDLHYNLALVRARQGRLVEAEAEYRAALRLQPDNVDVLNNLATCLMHQGRMHEAVPLLRKGPQLKPGDPTLQANLNQAMEPSGER